MAFESSSQLLSCEYMDETGKSACDYKGSFFKMYPSYRLRHLVETDDGGNSRPRKVCLQHELQFRIEDWDGDYLEPDEKK